jgi:2-polyprenyl-3-methyl-5-hydroxy-6-metoxy-1,4-benzoquinol methylase
MDGYGSSVLGQWDWILWAIESSPYPHRFILDVGAGHGKAAVLLREYLNVKPHYVDALEPNLHHSVWSYEGSLYRYVEPHLMQDFDAWSTYDTVLMADVIEHVEVPVGLQVINAIPGQVIVSTPTDALESDNTGVPPLEQHISQWTTDMLLDLARLGRRQPQFFHWPKGDARQLIVRLGPKGL